ncbi:MAG: M48 family metallopeptidase [Candidatus Micrarchaeota archaeon]|nr:M48 family metallopeptidase [Candidatus Micrarchaeota archaeon]
MASFFDEIGRNRLKSIALLAAFFLLFTAIIFIFTLFLGLNIFGLVIAAVLVALYAMFAYFMGGQMVLKISGAQKADPKKYHYLYDIVEGMALASQVKTPDIYIINDPNPNAFATGRDRKHASIAVTTGLLSMMDKRELQGVIAHEMSHVADNDIKFMLIAVVFAGVIGLIAAMFRGLFWFGGLGSGRGRGGGIVILIALAIGLLAPLFALLLRLAISRRREYMADANGGRITRDPQSLAGALQKIKDYMSSPKAQPVARANETTASLYFSSPLRASSIVNLFSTHPPIDERIKRLKQMY